MASGGGVGGEGGVTPKSVKMASAGEMTIIEPSSAACVGAVGQHAAEQTTQCSAAHVQAVWSRRWTEKRMRWSLR
jgi:hypothetical protein